MTEKKITVSFKPLNWFKPNPKISFSMPSGGPGSTLMACESTGRVAFLVEKDPAYCDVICDRWQAGGGVAPRRVHGKARNK